MHQRSIIIHIAYPPLPSLLSRCPSFLPSFPPPRNAKTGRNTRNTHTHTHTHRGMSKGDERRKRKPRGFCVHRCSYAKTTVRLRPFQPSLSLRPSLSLSLSLSILSPTPPLLSFQRCNNSSRPNRPEVGRRFFSRRLAVFQCALCARVSPPLPRQDLFPTLVISALPFVSPPPVYFFSPFIRFDSLFFALRSLPIFEFSISRLWLWRERERER